MTDFPDFEKALATYVEAVTNPNTGPSPQRARENLERALDRYLSAKIETWWKRERPKLERLERMR